VDILSDLDIRWFISQAAPDALATIIVSERKTQRYFLFDDDSMRMVGWTNTATGEVRSPFGDIDPEKYRKLAFAGIHCISGDIFKVFDEDGWGDRFSITDFYIRECGRHLIRGVVPPDFHLLDVGKVETLSVAEDFLRNIL
jgi:N-acetyl-alpha-D-muramate 1-phosphate uridylyltransferase